MNRWCRLASRPSFLLRVSLGLAVASVVFGTRFDVTTASGADVWGYDLGKGTDAEDIRRKFKLHRGRWWNYYERGSWYLRYGHYQAAERDFRVVIEKRPTDKRDARTYGMHFRDSFGRRELGISLYYRAIEAKARGEDDDELALLKESISELDQSLGQVKSARAEYFRNLAIGNRWKASAYEQKDLTPPAIRVENETSISKNFGIVYTNQPSVQLNIRVTDDQSGVGAIWVNEEELLVERSEANVLKTVYVPVDATNPLIRIHARDLVGNANNVPVEVRVVRDMTPPALFTTSFAAQMTPNGLIALDCSVRDDIGLRTVQVNDKRIDCSHLREFNVLARVPPEPNSSRVDIWVTDLAGNITKGYADFLSNDDRSARFMRFAPRLVRPVYFAAMFPAGHMEPRISSAFLSDGFSGPAVMRMAARDSQEMSFDSLVLRAAATLVGGVEPAPALEFTNYVDEPGGVLVVGTEFSLNITIKHAADVNSIELNGQGFDISQPSETTEFVQVSLPIRFDAYGENRVEVKAFSPDGSQVGVARHLVFRIVRDPTMQLESLYSVFVLPLVPHILSNNTRPQKLYQDLRDATIDCRLFPNGPPRFNTDIMERLAPNELKMEQGYPKAQAIKIGKTRGVDLSIWGNVTEHGGGWEVAVSLVDNESEHEFSLVDNKTTQENGNILDDLYLLKDPDEWRKHMKDFETNLQKALRRIRGKVVNKSHKGKRIYIDVGSERKLFEGQKLCVFKHEKKLLEARLAHAVVDQIPAKGLPEVKITESSSQYYTQIQRIEEDEFIIITK